MGSRSTVPSGKVRPPADGSLASLGQSPRRAGLALDLPAGHPPKGGAQPMRSAPIVDCRRKGSQGGATARGDCGRLRSLGPRSPPGERGPSPSGPVGRAAVGVMGPCSSSRHADSVRLEPRSVSPVWPGLAYAGAMEAGAAAASLPPARHGSTTAPPTATVPASLCRPVGSSRTRTGQSSRPTSASGEQTI